MNDLDLKIIRETSLFGKLPETELREVLGNEPPRNYTKGQILFQQDEAADRFFIVLSGWVKLYRQVPNGEEAILHVFTKGETIAEVALFTGHCYPATAEVICDARMLSINCNYFEMRLRDSPRIAMNMLASTAIHLKNLVSEIEQMKGRNSTQRLAHLLLEMCPNEAASAVIELPYEKTVIAATLGIQPESLSRTLQKLRGYGVNSIKSQIIVSDVDALRRLTMGLE